MIRKSPKQKSSELQQSPSYDSSDEMVKDELNTSEEGIELESLLARPPEAAVEIASEETYISKMIQHNPEFFHQAFKLAFCFGGLQTSYLTWGIMQELIMTTSFEPTEGAPDGRFPSAAFCVFSNRFLAVIVAIIAVRIKHGAVFANNSAPLQAFTPAAISNTISSWSNYAALRYVSFPVQTIFKSSKIIAVMMMGKFLKGTTYPYTQYVEAFFITCGVALFSLAMKSPKEETETQLHGLLFLLLYISFDSFTSQWQDKVYTQYGRANVDPYQMMLGINSSAIIFTTAGLVFSGDFPVVWEFLLVNPIVLKYNIITAITSASGQLCIFYTIREFGPVIFTLIMIIRQMLSICISAVYFNHEITAKASFGMTMVFGVLFYQARRKYYAKLNKPSQSAPALTSGGK
ncbi:unnamed protein product [Cylindrotheca closterium]|uniref:Uncharacterized protein n=1 Tax=Cylindrotheca closterium TaxID=2856 RepID=A0AAD2CNP1_9STRA|nr:unnamed protein product [Cylindrotheca closterium]